MNGPSTTSPDAEGRRHPLNGNQGNQMQPAWVTGNINRLLQIPPDNPWHGWGQLWGTILNHYRANGRLYGIAYSTPYTPSSGPAGPTVVIDVWHY
jgi:hypothetical protein